MDYSGGRLNIAIIGGGFAGVSVLAELHRQHHLLPLNITLFEKTGQFGAGYAYQTPYVYHLLNGRAHAMSAFCDMPEHFVDWLRQNKLDSPHLSTAIPLAEQFVPRIFYQEYLQSILQDILQKTPHRVILSPHEVKAVTPNRQVVLANTAIAFDKIVLALGNPLPQHLPFQTDGSVHIIQNPWDYTEIASIPSHDNVLIMGTGLSMVDSVLSLHHHHHQGQVVALSRHGLLPLPHDKTSETQPLDAEDFPTNLNQLIRHVRLTIHNSQQHGQDWRSMINGLRKVIPTLWVNLAVSDKQRFLRHYLAYWNIHRHRVHEGLADLLTELCRQQRLHVMAGRVSRVKDGCAIVWSRTDQKKLLLPIKHIVNCTGPSLRRVHDGASLLQGLLKSGLAILDPLQLGLQATEYGQVVTANGAPSDWLYVLGSLTQGMRWETVAVPEISQQSQQLVNQLTMAVSVAC